MFTDFDIDFEALDFDTQTEVDLSSDKDYRFGYSINQHGIVGRMLFDHRRIVSGKNLVMRLKDNGNNMEDEVIFWAKQLVDLVTNCFELTNFDYVTHPPSSEKSSYHLATNLAKIVSRELCLPYRNVYTNDDPRKSRASIHAKLQEEKKFSFSGGAKDNILFVDDAIHTRKTARACIKFLKSSYTRWVFLYG